MSREDCLKIGFYLNFNGYICWNIDRIQFVFFWYRNLKSYWKVTRIVRHISFSEADTLRTKGEAEAEWKVKDEEETEESEWEKGRLGLDYHPLQQNHKLQSANHKEPILFLVLPAYHSLRYNYTNSIGTFLKCNVLPGCPTITPCRSSLGIKNRLYSFEQVQSGGEMCCFVVQSMFWATGQKRQIVLFHPLGLCLDKELLCCEMFCSRYHQSMIHHQRLIIKFNLGHLGDEIHLPTLSSALRDQVPTLIKGEYNLSRLCNHLLSENFCSVKNHQKKLIGRWRRVLVIGSATMNRSFCKFYAQFLQISIRLFNAFPHHWRGSIDFNTVNTTRPREAPPKLSPGSKGHCP